MLTLGTFAHEVAKHIAADKAAHFITKVAEDLVAPPPADRQRQLLDRASKLFFPRGEFHCTVANQAPNLVPTEKIGGQLTYANERFVVNLIRALVPQRVDAELTSGPYAIPSHDPILCVGSSLSHPYSAEVFGQPTAPRFKFTPDGQNYSVNLPYSIALLEGVQVRRIQDERVRITNEYAIIRPDGEILTPIRDQRDWLKQDLLLFTRLPLRVGDAQSDAVIIAGMHGPAIRATEHLLEHLSAEDFDFLEERIANHPHFQAVFDVLDLAVEDGTTKPSKGARFPLAVDEPP